MSAKEKMNILIVSSLKPTATANYFIHAFLEAGHRLLVCSDVASPLATVIRYGCVDVADLCAAKQFEPDLALFVEGGSMQLLPVGLDKLNCVTAWYGIDTHMDYAKHVKLARLFDVTFVAQKEFVLRLREEGIRQVHWLPLAFAPELMPAVMPSRDFDIAYVGSDNAVMHPVRHALLKALRQAFERTSFGMASPKDMASIYSRAKIVFNKSVNNDVNMRYFEAMGAGAVLVTDPAVNNGLEDLFQEGTHYLSYTDEVTLLAQVRALLSDPQRLQAMSEAGRRLMLEKHTYRHRCEALLAVLAESRPLASYTDTHAFSACLALGMPDGAGVLAARSLRAMGGSPRQRVQARVLAALVSFVTLPLQGLAWLHWRIRR